MRADPASIYMCTLSRRPLDITKARAIRPFRAAPAEFPVRSHAVLGFAEPSWRVRLQGSSRAPGTRPPNSVTTHSCRLRGNTSPLTSRHARRHLTTLRLRRGMELGASTPAAGLAHLRPTSVGCRRRITRTRLGALAETRAIRAKESFLPVWQGESVYGDCGHRTVTRAAGIAAGRQPVRVVGAHSLVDHWISGGTSRAEAA